MKTTVTLHYKQNDALSNCQPCKFSFKSEHLPHITPEPNILQLGVSKQSCWLFLSSSRKVFILFSLYLLCSASKKAKLYKSKLSLQISKCDYINRIDQLGKKLSFYSHLSVRITLQNTASSSTSNISLAICFHCLIPLIPRDFLLMFDLNVSFHTVISHYYSLLCHSQPLSITQQGFLLFNYL